MTPKDPFGDLRHLPWAFLLRALTVLGVIISVWSEYLVVSIAFSWRPTFMDVTAPFAIGAFEFLLIDKIRVASTFDWVFVLMFVGCIPAAVNFVWQANRGWKDNALASQVLGRNVRGLRVYLGRAMSASIVVAVLGLVLRPAAATEVVTGALQVVIIVAYLGGRSWLHFTRPVNEAAARFGLLEQYRGLHRRNPYDR